MFPDEWDDYHEWCRPAVKRTWRNAFIRAGSDLLGLAGFLWAVSTGMFHWAWGFGRLFEAVAEALHRADAWLAGFTEYEEDLDAYRERMGIPEIEKWLSAQNGSTTATR